MSIFSNKDYYPTPESVIYSMGIDCQNKVVLEPSAGNGNIVEWLKENGAKEVLTCEFNKDLAEIVKTKSKFLQHDFLTLDPIQVSHIQMIIMNPPFSNGDKHILKAWEIAPDGCEIISLCNSETFENDWSSRRKELLSIIKNYGSTTILGDVFSDAERKTGVSIGLVKLYKPGKGNNEFDGFFMDEEIEERQENGIMRFDAIRDIVQRYVGAVKCFEEHEVISERMNLLTDKFDVNGFSFSISHQNSVTSKEMFKKELQKKAWLHLFRIMNIQKYVTSGVMKDINKFVENQSNIPFTMKNIYHMFDVIVGTREQTFDRAIEEVVDKFTMHTHENRYKVEGWKTNSGYMLNPKFIIDYIFETGWGNSGKLSLRWGNNHDKLMDLAKVLCSLTGKDYEELDSLHHGKSSNKHFDSGIWYSWDFTKVTGEGDNQITTTYPGFFEFKGFKKGTMHLKFKDKMVCEILNRRYAKIKGQVLPEKFRI